MIDIRHINLMTKSRDRRTPTDRELRAYYERSSRLQEGGAVRQVKLSFPRPRRLVALRLEEETLEGIKRLAVRKGLNYSTLMRMWITERWRRERA